MTFRRFCQSNHGLIPCDDGAYMMVEDALTLERELSSAQAALAEAKAEVAVLKAAHWLHSLSRDELESANFYADIESMKTRAERAEAECDKLLRAWENRIDAEGELTQLRARVTELQRLLGEVYRNTNLRHHPELTGLADIVSKQLNT
jgi:hypothetical protein